MLSYWYMVFVANQFVLFDWFVYMQALAEFMAEYAHDKWARELKLSSSMYMYIPA